MSGNGSGGAISGFARPYLADAVRPEAVGRLRELATVLTARGLAVRVEPEHGLLVVRNESTAPDDPSDPLAVAYGSAHLTQRVRIACGSDGALTWYWQWSGATRDAPPEYERLCPAGAIAEASERITRVVALAAR